MRWMWERLTTGDDTSEWKLVKSDTPAVYTQLSDS